MIDGVTTFISGIESMFSVYRSGMRDEIRRHFEKTENFTLLKIFDVIKRKWEKDKAPSLSAIIRICREEGISIKSQNTEIISICEFCYTGTSPSIENDKKPMADYPYPHDKTKWPKKIILIDGNTNFTCHYCHNAPILGLCLIRKKGGHINQQKESEEPEEKKFRNNYEIL
jgi:hypothetical protein